MTSDLRIYRIFRAGTSVSSSCPLSYCPIPRKKPRASPKSVTISHFYSAFFYDLKIRQLKNSGNKNGISFFRALETFSSPRAGAKFEIGDQSRPKIKPRDQFTG
ncbi:Uncharacterized protein dnm_039900 [Desulfonema magnum]|uniref:Uncharacterized protein n=1 Tax=Desulfonema magnum TaxID=45655 RepID=A0A975BM26_9BACT|nr:Uncharacterized protein dnm_039900 [Desulfonema magnum]